MILVTVGTHNKGFDRLIEAVDEAAGRLEEEVIIQRGCSQTVPRRCGSFRYCSQQRMAQLNQEARVVIAHAAAGSIILALQSGTPIVLVPRSKRYGEAIDDHQLQLARTLAERGMGIPVYELNADSLLNAVAEARKLRSQPANATDLVNALRRQLSEWAMG